MRISLDGLGTSLGTYGLEGRARCVPDEVVDRGLPRSLLYNSASVVICLYPQLIEAGKYRAVIDRCYPLMPEPLC